MKIDNIVHMKIEFEHQPILDSNLRWPDEVEKAFEMVRRKLN